MRQIGGMKDTEGSSSAGRLAPGLIAEAMQVGARFGYDVSAGLAGWQMISWPNQVDTLMIGMLRRRPDLLDVCTTAWCGLCLPYYLEPYYRDPYHVGDFIDVAADAAGAEQIAQLTAKLRTAIEIDSRAHERVDLLTRLRTGAARHGHKDAALDLALSRWTAEAPEPRRSYTEDKYDNANSLDELEQAFANDGQELNYNAPYRFRALAKNADLGAVKSMYENWKVLKDDPRCRFMVAERLVEAGDSAYARQLLADYDALPDSSRSWNQWAGAHLFHYFKVRKMLDGAAMHGEAFESLVDSINAGEENTQGLLAHIESLLPLITAAPDWPTIWDMLAEQMGSTREFRMGAAFEPCADPMSDEQIISELLHFALRMPVPEVQRNARDCAIQLVEQDGVAAESVVLTMRRLLGAELDSPLQALTILLAMGSGRLASSLGHLVEQLGNHRDVAVVEAAGLLAHQWGIHVGTDRQPLPLFYRLELRGTGGDKDTGLEDESGAMRVEDSLGWTRMFQLAASSLAEAAETDELHIRRRAGLFIQEWGGLEAFGPPAIKRIQSQLRALDMQISYTKPHALIGQVALRHVAGEIRRAGMLQRSHMPVLLEQLGAPLPPRAGQRPQPLPTGIRRPNILRNASWNEREGLWAEHVNSDAIYWNVGPGMHLLAEVSKYEILQARQAKYTKKLIRAPRLVAEGEDFWDWYKELPAAVWLGRVMPLDDELAPTLVRRFVNSFGPDDDGPSYPITICPHWLRRLSWRPQDRARTFFVDSRNTVVGHLGYWRDGGPVDLNSDSIWGDGCFLALTDLGLQQYKAIVGDVPINCLASRQVEKSRYAGPKAANGARHTTTL